MSKHWILIIKLASSRANAKTASVERVRRVAAATPVLTKYRQTLVHLFVLVIVMLPDSKQSVQKDQ